MRSSATSAGATTRSGSASTPTPRSCCRADTRHADSARRRRGVVVVFARRRVAGCALEQHAFLAFRRALRLLRLALIGAAELAACLGATRRIAARAPLACAQQ